MSDPNAAAHESNRHFYDRIANAYDLLADANERAARQTGVRALGLKAGEAVLELGFGTGNEVLDLAALVGPTGRVAGIDISPGMLAVANGKLAAYGREPQNGDCPRYCWWPEQRYAYAERDQRV